MIRKKRCIARRQPAESKRECRGETLRRPRRPIDRCVEAKRPARIEEAENIRIIGAAILQSEIAKELVPLVDALVDARLYRIRMGHVDHRNLIVVPRVVQEIRQRKILQKGSRLWTDLVRWNNESR